MMAMHHMWHRLRPACGIVTLRSGDERRWHSLRLGKGAGVWADDWNRVFCDDGNMAACADHPVTEKPAHHPCCPAACALCWCCGRVGFGGFCCVICGVVALVECVTNLAAETDVASSDEATCHKPRVGSVHSLV